MPLKSAQQVQPGRVRIMQGDNMAYLPDLDEASYDLIYIDPPYNTGKSQRRTQIVTTRDDQGDRVGFQGQRYKSTPVASRAYADRFDDYLAFLYPRLEQAYRLLNEAGSLFLQLDFREIHYVKVMLDQIFGRDSFINEIIWAYDYGARSKKRWSTKHDNILWYAKDPKHYYFDFESMDRIPYMAPGLVSPAKAARGKTPTDVWWHTIVSPNGKEKTGYPTQKPLGVVSRIVKVHSAPGHHLLDFFAGSGTLAMAAAPLGRHVDLVDQNPEAIDVMQQRLAEFEPTIQKAPKTPQGVQS